MLRWDNRPVWDSAIWDNVSGTPVDMGDGDVVIGSQARFNMAICTPPKLEPLHLRSSAFWRVDRLSPIL